MYHLKIVQNEMIIIYIITMFKSLFFFYIFLVQIPHQFYCNKSYIYQKKKMFKLAAGGII